jgi:O-succinylbenzoic acid--CoA ligase
LRLQYVDHSRKKSIDTFLKEWENSEETITVNTSGSTGKPKLIKLKKEHVLISAKKTLAQLSIPTSSTFHLGLSTKTIAGKMMIIRALANNSKLLIGNVSSDTLNSINEDVHFSALVPLQLQHYLEQTPRTLVDTILVGGAMLSINLEQLAANYPKRIYQSYGMTETISHVALRRIQKEISTSYHALPGIEFSRNDANELIIHYPEINPLPILTTDVVELKDPYTFSWLGRSDFCINTGGIKLFPETIESQLTNLIPYPIMITSLPDDRLGSILVLLIETNDSPSFSKDMFSDILGTFEIPKYFQVLQSFAKTENGKINRTLTEEKISPDAWRKIL